MRNLIKCIAVIVAAGLWCAGMAWSMAQERKLRQERKDLARARRARGLLRLSDKPYMLPKQNPLGEVWGKWPGDEEIGDILEALNQDQEIVVIQGDKEPEAVPRCDYQCASGKEM